MPQGASVTRPYSSPLMKLPILPKVYPRGMAGQKRSASRQKSTLRRRQEIGDADQDTDGAAVIGHAADPHKSDTVCKFEGENDLQGVVEVIREIVEQRITESSAQDKAHDAPDENVLDGLRVKIIGLPFDAVKDEEIGQSEGHKIHEAVITELKGAEGKEIGADVFGRCCHAADEEVI